MTAINRLGVLRYKLWRLLFMPIELQPVIAQKTACKVDNVSKND